MYVSFTPLLSHPGSQYPCTPWNTHVFQYIDVLTCVIYTCTRQNSKNSGSIHACHDDYQQRQVGECADTWYKWIQPTGTVKLYSCPATCQHACVILNGKRLTSFLYCCFMMFISTKARHWTCYKVPVCVLFVDVEPYRLTMLRHHWH